MTESNPPSALAAKWYLDAFDDCWTAHMDATDMDASAKRYVDAVLTAAEPHVTFAMQEATEKATDQAAVIFRDALTAARAEWASAEAEQIAAARREGREAGLREAVAAVQEQYFTCDNDIEIAKCEGISMAHGAITVLITNLQEPT